MNVEISDAEKQEMLAELLVIVRRKTRDQYPAPNITSAEFAEIEGVSNAEAYGRLEAAVQRGELVKEGGVHINGMLRNLYWKA